MWTFKTKALTRFGASPSSGSQTEHLETLGWFVCDVFQPTGFSHPDMEQWHKLWFGHWDSSRWWHLSQHFHVECKQDHKTRKKKETLIIKQNTNMPKYLHKNSKIWVIIQAWIFCSLQSVSIWFVFRWKQGRGWCQKLVMWMGYYNGCPVLPLDSWLDIYALLVGPGDVSSDVKHFAVTT